MGDDDEYFNHAGKRHVLSGGINGRAITTPVGEFEVWTKRTGNNPDAAQLLGIAREALVDELLPALPESLRYTCRMVANAIAIAEREIAAPRPGAEIPRERAAEAGALEGADWRGIVEQMRSGEFEGEDAQRAAVHAALLAEAKARVAVSNPRVLMQDDPE